MYSHRSQQYHHESSSKSERKDDDSNDSNENNRSNGGCGSNDGNQDNDSDKDNSEGTQSSDYEDEFEEIVDGHNRYIKANRKAFRTISDDDYIEECEKEKQFIYFTQNTKEQSILSQNDLFKTLWINWMKMDEVWLKKYIMKGEFNSLWFDNIEDMLDFTNDDQSFYDRIIRKDIQHKKVINCFLILEIKQIESLTLRASNQQIDEDINIHFNALNLYLFYQLFSKIRSEYLILEGFEFYSSPNHDKRQKFADFIKNALQFYKLEFRNCKFHTNKTQLFNNKYLDQKISIKNCIYSIERNGEVIEKYFNERGVIVTSNKLEDLKKRRYHQERSQNYKSVAGNPHFLASSSRYYCSFIFLRKRSQSLDFQLSCIQILDMDKSESVSLNSSSSDYYESPDEKDFD